MLLRIGPTVDMRASYEPHYITRLARLSVGLSVSQGALNAKREGHENEIGVNGRTDKVDKQTRPVMRPA